MFTCFSVIPVIVKIPTRAASARARLGSNDGEGGHMGTTKRHTAPGTCRKGELGRATVIIVRPTQAQFLRRESRKARVLAPSSHLALQLAPTSRRPAASTQTTSREAKRIHHAHDAGSAQTGRMSRRARAYAHTFITRGPGSRGGAARGQQQPSVAVVPPATVFGGGGAGSWVGGAGKRRPARVNLCAAKTL